MHTPPIGQAEIDARVAAHVDELLELWRAEQGAGKPRDLDLMALIMPFPRDETVSLLDLGCGPGDFGRAVRQVYPNARIDGIDRDPFLTSICKAVSQRDGTPGRLIVRDLYDNTWSSGLPNDYHAVAMVNALHWFDVAAAERLLRDVYAILRDGGVFLLAEPTSPERPFSNGFEAWKATQPARYSRENWERFWSRANAVLGYDHVAFLGARARQHIDDSMSVAGWINLLRAAGFRLIDVVLRDADQVILAAVKSSS